MPSPLDFELGSDVGPDDKPSKIHECVEPTIYYRRDDCVDGFVDVYMVVYTEESYGPMMTTGTVGLKEDVTICAVDCHGILQRFDRERSINANWQPKITADLENNGFSIIQIENVDYLPLQKLLFAEEAKRQWWFHKLNDLQNLHRQKTEADKLVKKPEPLSAYGRIGLSAILQHIDEALFWKDLVLETSKTNNKADRQRHGLKMSYEPSDYSRLFSFATISNYMDAVIEGVDLLREYSQPLKTEKYRKIFKSQVTGLIYMADYLNDCLTGAEPEALTSYNALHGAERGQIAAAAAWILQLTTWANQVLTARENQPPRNRYLIS
jgi:hypothetical protein